MSRIDRYILRGILPPFIGSVVFVALVAFLLQAQRLATSAFGLGFTATDALLIFLAALPPFLILAVPIAYLLSVLVGLGRLGVDLELTAMRAAGASPLRIVRVPVLLGALVSLAALPLSYYGESYGLNLLYARLVDVGLRNLTQAIQPGIFNESFGGIALFAKGRTAAGQLEDVLLYDARDRARPTLALAAEGELGSPGKNELVISLRRGEMYLASESPAARTTSTATATDHRDRWDRVRYQQAYLGIDIADELRGKTRVVSDIGRMSSEEMREAYQRLGPDDRLGRGIERSYWRRFALPLMALVFSVVGCGLALGGRGGPRAKNALLAIMAVVGYYVLLRVADLISLNTRGAAVWMAWAPNLIALSVGAALLWRAERPQ